MNTQTTLAQRIAEHGITMQCTPVHANPHMSDAHIESSHWKCRLKSGRRTMMTVTFTMGPAFNGRAPRTEEVLNCLASDAAGVENAQSFEDWCAEYGYDTDSRKAERTFKACKSVARRLQAFMADDAAYQALLFETLSL